MPKFKLLIIIVSLLLIGCSNSSVNNAAIRTKIYVMPHGAAYHQEGCCVLDKNAVEIDLEQAQKRYFPCSKCKPPQ